MLRSKFMSAYLYQYGVGAVVFAVGLYVGFRQGYLSLRGPGRWRLVLVFAPLLFVGGLQAYLQFAPMTEAPAVAYAGGAPRQATLGTPLDYGIMVGYFLLILAVGSWYGRGQATLNDFFFAG
ncbi:MAG: hypothetical protein KDD47_01535, partial [Acidobacteria bacterium]|nr:hypothetical protein [Acidobacteriota bacterium]